MTVVIASVFQDGILVCSDSRASTENQEVEADILQKIVGVNDYLIVGYAGAVPAVTRTMADVQTTLRTKHHSRDETLGVIREAALRDMSLHKQGFTLFAFYRNKAGWKAFGFTGPYFDSYEITDISLIGSGAVISDRIIRLYAEIKDNDETLKTKADRIIWGASSALGATEAIGVGGMMQAMLLTTSGVTTIHSGYIDMDPDAEPESKQIVYEDNHWIQKDLASGHQQMLMVPQDLTDADMHTNVFHNYEKGTGGKNSKWYVNSFLTALRISKTPTGLKAEGSLNALSFGKLPNSASFQCYLGFFGPSTEHKFEMIHVSPDGSKKVIHSESFDNSAFPFEYEMIRTVMMSINSPGLHLLECRIDGNLASTKALVVAQADSRLSDKKNLAALSKTQEKTEDEALESTDMVYLSISGEPGQFSDSVQNFEGQFDTVISNSFPLNMNAYIDCGIRSERGKHSLRIEMIDAATHKVLSSESIDFIASSSTKTKPTQGRIGLKFPLPGYYFLRVFIDDEAKGCLVLGADGHPPRFTYLLPDQELEKLKNSDYLVMAKRPVQV